MPDAVSVIGCGWLGLPLAKKLLDLGYKVKGSTTSPHKLPLLKNTDIEPFLLTLNPLPEGNLNAFLQTDVLIVNIPPATRKNPEAASRHMQQMQVLFEATEGSSVKKVVFVSSTSVYAPLNRAVTEADANIGLPTTASGQVLRQVEHLWQSSSRFHTTILRMAGLAGGTRHPGRFLAGKTDVLYPEAPVNLLHLEDAVAVICEVLQQNTWKEVFNVCADEFPSRGNFYTYAALQLHLAPPIFTNTDMQAQYNYISNKKLKQQLQYRFLFPDPMLFVYDTPLQ